MKCDIDKIRPVGDRLLIRRPPDIEEELSDGGIIKPAAWTETAVDPRDEVHRFGMRKWTPLVECEVLAVGPGERDADGNLAPMSIEPGCSVLLTGAPVDSIDYRHCFVRERDVLAVVRRDEERMTIDAASDRLLLEVEAEQTHYGVIEIPEAHRRRVWEGRVISAGPGAWAVVRNRAGIEVRRGGCRQFKLRGGKPYRIEHGIKPGAWVKFPAQVQSIDFKIGERSLLLALTVESIAYSSAA